jgi:hypothetical protein
MAIVTGSGPDLSRAAKTLVAGFRPKSSRTSPQFAGPIAQVQFDKDKVTVTLYTYNAMHRQTIYRNVDVYKRGSYVPKAARTVIAQGPAGFFF